MANCSEDAENRLVWHTRWVVFYQHVFNYRTPLANNLSQSSSVFAWLYCTPTLQKTRNVTRCRDSRSAKSRETG